MSTFRPTVDPAYAEKMKAVARTIDEFFNGKKKGAERTVGFCLLVFPFGGEPGQRVNYMSNADRRDMVVAIKELLARFEGFDPEEGHA